MNKNNKQNNINYLHLNKSNSNFYTKMIEIHDLIQVCKAHITIITEANIGNEGPDEIVEINNLFEHYKFEAKPIFNDKVSRILLIIDDKIKYTRRTDLESSDIPCVIIEIQISTRKSKFLVGYYRQWKLLNSDNPHPSRSPIDQMHRFGMFRQVMESVAMLKKPFVIMGDLNLDRCHINNPYQRGDIKDTLPLLDSLIEDLNCTQLNWKPTRFRAGQRPTCLDLVISNVPAKIADISPVTNLTSEHEGISCKYSDSDFSCPEQFNCFRRYKNVTTTNILNCMNMELYNAIFSMSEPDDIANNIINMMTETIDILAPIVKHQIRRKTTFQSQRTADLRSESKRLFKKFKRSNDIEDQRELKNTKNRLTRSIKADSKKEVEDELESNFWKKVKKYKISENAVPTRVKVDDKLTSSPIVIATAFNEFFVEKVKKIRENIPKTSIDPIDILAAVVPKPASTFNFSPANTEEVYEVIKNMKNSKNTGVDNISAAFIKKIPRVCAPLMCHLFNNILRTSTFPKILKRSRILPLKKPGKEHLLLNSYRPINNLSVIDKIIEELLRSQLDKYFEENQILAPNNHGGRQGHGTQSAHLAIQSTINTMTDKKKVACIMSTDLSAAFDLVDVKIFKRKLEFYGLENSATKLITSYMTGRTSTITLQGYSSPEVNCEECGSVQGGKLSGLFFNISVNDANYIQSIMKKPTLYRSITKDDLELNTIEHDIISYVDDQNNVIAGETEADIEAYLKSFMKLLIHFYGANRLKLNDEKTQIMLLRSRFRRCISIKASNGEIVWNIAQMKILGIHVNPNNNMLTHISIARSRAFHRMHELQPLLKNIHNIDQRRIIISSQVISIIRYCSVLYCGQNQTVTSKFHTALMRMYRIIFNGCTYMTRCEKICSEVKMPMPKELIYKDAMIFIHRLLTDKKPKQLYSLIRIPGRLTRVSIPTLSIKCNTERSRRGAYNVMVTKYATLPPELRGLSVNAFKSIVRNKDYNVLTSSDQRL